MGILEDSESKPLSNAQWIVGDAANGSKSICGKFGKVVMRLRTDVQGNFKLNRLPPGEYWVTYVDPQDGESFLIRLDKGRRSSGRLELQIDQLKGLRYLVDIERYATKPMVLARDRARIAAWRRDGWRAKPVARAVAPSECRCRC